MRTVHRLHAGNHVRAVRERDEPIALGFVVPALTDHLRLVEAPVMLESQRQRFVRDLVAQISNEDAMVVCRPGPPYTYTSSTSERVQCKLSHHSIGTHRAQGAAGCGLWSAFQITLYSNACGEIGETQSLLSVARTFRPLVQRWVIPRLTSGLPEVRHARTHAT